MGSSEHKTCHKHPQKRGTACVWLVTLHVVHWIHIHAKYSEWQAWVWKSHTDWWEEC